MEEGRPVTILVTGFGPYGEDSFNPSYVIATTLPALLPPTPTCPVPVRISLYPYQIPVSYEEVRALVPRLYAAYHGGVDMILHMGMTSTRNYYSIEKFAHRDGYDGTADIYGTKLDKHDGLNFWPDCPPILETSLDFDDIFQRWRSYLLEPSPTPSSVLDGLIIRPSQDAGHFMCDFIYYSTLAEYWRKKKDHGHSGDKIDERPVMFMHVPSWTAAQDLERGKVVTTGLLRALAQSWTVKKSEGKSSR